ncbi:MAG: LytR/AlgR family response regulator transcription factor [Bacteroidia bacterium]
MNALIIDDEPLAHEVILRYAEDLPFLNIVGQCYLATEAYTKLSQSTIDLIFLDIQMPKLKGLDFLRTLDQKPQVIITSAFQEYALEGFELQVCDYLLKPFRFERFVKAVNKAKQQLDLLEQETTEFTSGLHKGVPTHLILKVDKRHLKVELAQIEYLESYGNYVKVWVKGNFHLVARTLSSFEAELSALAFMRIHKSYLIQKSWMQYVEGNMIGLKNGSVLPIGKSYRQAVKQWIS